MYTHMHSWQPCEGFGENFIPYDFMVDQLRVYEDGNYGIELKGKDPQVIGMVLPTFFTFKVHGHHEPLATRTLDYSSTIVQPLVKKISFSSSQHEQTCQNDNVLKRVC